MNSRRKMSQAKSPGVLYREYLIFALPKGERFLVQAIPPSGEVIGTWKFYDSAEEAIAHGKQLVDTDIITRQQLAEGNL